LTGWAVGDDVSTVQNHDALEEAESEVEIVHHHDRQSLAPALGKGCDDVEAVADIERGGWLIGQDAAGRLLHYDVLGYVTIGAFLLCIVLMYYVNSYMMQKKSAAAVKVDLAAVEA